MSGEVAFSGSGRSLRPYQEEGVAFLMVQRHALLADEMGLGKTVQVAQALNRLHKLRQMRRALIVAPASLQLNWIRELNKWGPDVAIRTTSGRDVEERLVSYELPIPIVVTSYENLRADFLVCPPELIFDVVVFDEAQRIKNIDSDAAVAARRVQATMRWLVSATPLENRIEDVISLLRASGLGGVNADTPITQVIEVLQGHFLRRRKRDVLPQLPPILDQTITLGLSPEQDLEYSEIVDAFDSGGAGVANLLATITSLKHICNRASSGESSKLDLLLTLMDDPGVTESRFIVVSQYVETLTWLYDPLSQVARTYMLTGHDSLEERETAVTNFCVNPGPTVLLLSLKAGGVGLNIPAASHVVLFDRWWNPAAEDQVIHRAHRFGRTEPLLSYRFLVDNTVEERIDRILARKAKLFADVIDHDDPSAAAGASPRLTRAELVEVLRTD